MTRITARRMQATIATMMRTMMAAVEGPTSPSNYNGRGEWGERRRKEEGEEEEGGGEGGRRGGGRREKGGEEEEVVKGGKGGG